MTAIDIDEGPLVPVLADRYVPGGVVHRCVRLMTVQDANTRAHDTDAHKQVLATTEAMRLTLDVLPALPTPPIWHVLRFDVDPPDHKRTAEWDRWFAEVAAHLPGDPWVHWSKNGAAIEYLHEPVPVTSADDFTHEYLLDGIAIAAVTGIIIDAACARAVHLFRCAHVVRDGELQQLGYLRGNAARPGLWSRPTMSEGEKIAALGYLRTHSKAWRSTSMRLVEREERTEQSTTTHTNPSKALSWAVDKVANTGTGRRNEELYGRTTWLAGLVSKGELDKGAVSKAMLDAAKRAGLNEKEARRTIASALGGQ